MMPLFFIISGASLFYAIGKSGGWSRFYVDKFLRLMIPVLFSGFLILSSDRLQRNIKNQRWISLLLGVVLSFLQSSIKSPEQAETALQCH